MCTYANFCRGTGGLRQGKKKVGGLEMVSGKGGLDIGLQKRERRSFVSGKIITYASHRIAPPFLDAGVMLNK